MQATVDSPDRQTQKQWIAALTADRVGAMSSDELLEIIAAYRVLTCALDSGDHRRYLSRCQLERLVYLIRDQCARRLAH